MLGKLFSKSNKFFLSQFVAFWMISFIVFSPTANILFSIPKETKAQATDLSVISDSVTYGTSAGICAALLSGTAGSLGLSIVSTIFSVPSNSDMQNIVDTAGVTQVIESCTIVLGDKIKAAIIDALTYAATTAMHQLLIDLTNKIINCINTYDPQTGSCEGGDSLLVVDFNSMIQNAADIAGARFLNDLAGVNLCSIVPAVKLQLTLLPTAEFKQRAACTLDTIVSNINSFYNDFTNGGWAAWEESAKPNNNAFGEWITATDENIAKQYAEAKKAEKETTNGFKSTKKCISSTDESKYPASTLKADDIYCAASVVVTPSGTIETSVNFATLSPVRQLEGSLNGLYSKMGPFGVYLTAISNALLNKLTSTGLSALMNEITSSDTSSSNPYQDIINSTASTTSDYSSAQGDQAYAKSIISTLSSLDSYITSTAKTTYSDIVSVLTNIQTEQNKIINDYWAQGIIDSSTTYSITSGPTTVINTDGSQTTTTVYSVSYSKVGSATIQKQVTTFIDFTTTTTYSLTSSQNQIEGIDGALTTYTNKYNSLVLTQSQISPAQTQTQTTYDAITTYVNAWTGTSADTTNQTAMNTAISNTVSYFQNSANWTPALTSTALSGTYTDITSVYNTTLSNISTEIANQTKSTYDTYLSDVQTIYTNLGSSTTKL